MREKIIKTWPIPESSKRGRKQSKNLLYLDQQALSKFRFIYLIFFIFFFLAMDFSREKTEPHQKIDQLFSQIITKGEPGAAVLVIKNGQIVFKQGYGVAERRTFQPIQSQTNFRLASLTKAFTAASIILLVREGKLNYDTRLTDIFPEFPEYGRAIKIIHLLQHTSGLPDYEDLMPPEDKTKPIEEIQIKDHEVLALLQQTKSGKFIPGSHWDYSNSGYVLLGLIVEKISGQAFAEFLKRKIFEPLGMEKTVAYVRGQWEVPNRAFGHSKIRGKWVETDQSPTSATLGDGGVYSSIEDLAKWDEAWRSYKLLNEEEIKLALTPVQVPGRGPREPDGSEAAYGFGWFLNPWKGYRRIWHYGETRGFRTAIHRFPDENLTVIVLANRSDLEASSLALKIAEFYLK